MRVRFVGAPHCQVYDASGVEAFVIPMTVGEVRELPEAVAQKVLADHPDLFQAEAVDVPTKVEALDAPESDKQTRAPARRKG